MPPWDAFFWTLLIPVGVALLLSLAAKRGKVEAFVASLPPLIGLWWALWVAYAVVHMLNKYW